jgi:hypothetical protein
VVRVVVVASAAAPVRVALRAGPEAVVVVAVGGGVAVVVLRHLPGVGHGSRDVDHLLGLAGFPVGHGLGHCGRVALVPGLILERLGLGRY